MEFTVTTSQILLFIFGAGLTLFLMRVTTPEIGMTTSFGFLSLLTPDVLHAPSTIGILVFGGLLAAEFAFRRYQHLKGATRCSVKRRRKVHLVLLAGWYLSFLWNVIVEFL